MRKFIPLLLILIFLTPGISWAKHPILQSGSDKTAGRTGQLDVSDPQDVIDYFLNKLGLTDDKSGEKPSKDKKQQRPSRSTQKKEKKDKPIPLVLVIPETTRKDLERLGGTDNIVGRTKELNKRGDVSAIIIDLENCQRKRDRNGNQLWVCFWQTDTDAGEIVLPGNALTDKPLIRDKPRLFVGRYDNNGQPYFMGYNRSGEQQLVYKPKTGFEEIGEYLGLTPKKDGKKEKEKKDKK